MTAMFRSFAQVNYRIWFIGALVSNVGTWMQGTAQSWVVLTELTDHDATAVGITMALQFLPPLLLVPLTGLAADRIPRRLLLVITQAGLMLVAAAVGLLLLLGAMTLPLMYVLAFALGVFAAFDNPARQAFVSDLVARDHAANAVALNSASFNLARMAGPAVAGILIIAIGSGWVFIVNAATFAVMLGALALIRPGRLEPQLRPANSGGMAEGLRFVRSRPDLIVLFIMVFLLGTFGMNFPIVAASMAVEFNRGADGYGLLSSVLAIGSLAGALLSARRAAARLRVVVAAVALFGIASLVSILMPSYWSYAAVLVVVGFATVTALTTANGYVQTTTDPAVRGRVLALYLAVVMGGTPLGAPIVGWVVDLAGARAGIAVGAVATIVGAAIGLIWMIREDRFHRGPGRFRIEIDATTSIPTVSTGMP